MKAAPMALFIKDAEPIVAKAKAERRRFRRVRVDLSGRLFTPGDGKEAAAMGLVKFAVPDVAARLRLASPTMPIAFLTGGGTPDMLDAARGFGPVFCKVEGVEDAIHWVLAAVHPTGRG